MAPLPLLALLLSLAHAARKDLAWEQALSTSGEDAPLLEFQIFRAGTSEWPAKNSDWERSRNFANAAGVLRYVHNEVVGRNVAAKAKPPFCKRKYDIDTIFRYKVTMRSSPAAMARYGGFLPFVAMDKGKCTVPDCHMKYWEPYGYVPGCQRQNVEAFHYADAVWYSFPGRCPGLEWAQGNCRGKEDKQDPGGACRPLLTKQGDKVIPDGSWNCTYTYEPQGSIKLDRLVGIDKKWGSYEKFCMEGGVEFNGPNDDEDGLTIDFWRGYKDVEKNKERVSAMLHLFKKKYPKVPILDEPNCHKHEWTRPDYWP